MKVNRELQRQILECLLEHHPNVSISRNLPGYNTAHFMSNLIYLTQHGLVEGKPSGNSKGEITLSRCWLSATGYDHLLDDGGVDATKRTRIVKIDKGDLRQILDAMLAQADLPKDQKLSIAERLCQLPTDAVHSICLKVFEAGLSQLPGLLK